MDLLRLKARNRIENTQRMRQILERAERGLVSGLMENNYRENGMSQAQAIERAVRIIKKKNSGDRYGPENEFLSCTSIEIANQAAAKMIVIDNIRAIQIFNKNIWSECQLLRKACTDGLVDGLGICDDIQEFTKSLDNLAKAANSGIREASEAIEIRLREFFNIYENENQRVVQLKFAIAMHTPALKIAGTSASMIAFCYGASLAGVVFGLCAFGLHVMQEHILKGE
jgi:hypothetical protein